METEDVCESPEHGSYCNCEDCCYARGGEICACCGCLVVDCPKATDPEFKSIEAFVEFCMDDERTTFDHTDLGELAFNLHRSRCKVRAELESWGLTLVERPREKRVRGFTVSSHDRWFGLGSSKSHGGSGWEQISGFAGQKG
jgi:hypothetical protein